MWSMWDAPSDRDYYGQFNPYPDEEEPEEEMLRAGKPIHCAHCGADKETVDRDAFYLDVTDPVCCEIEAREISIQEAA
jgi:hypothetical protein